MTEQEYIDATDLDKEARKKAIQEGMERDWAFTELRKKYLRGELDTTFEEFNASLERPTTNVIPTEE